MSAVGRTGKHHEVTIYFSREQHSIAVKWEERILNASKRLEISCFCHADCCPIEILTPDNIICILYFNESRIICINRHKRLAILIYERNLILFETPMDCILTSSKIDIWNTVGLLTSEYTDKTIFIRHYRTVKNTCHTLQRISSDDRILAVSPDWCSVKFTCRSLLPRYIRYRRCKHLYFTHIYSPLHNQI